MSRLFLLLTILFALTAHTTARALGTTTTTSAVTNKDIHHLHQNVAERRDVILENRSPEGDLSGEDLPGHGVVERTRMVDDEVAELGTRNEEGDRGKVRGHEAGLGVR